MVSTSIKHTISSIHLFEYKDLKLSDVDTVNIRMIPRSTDRFMNAI